MRLAPRGFEEDQATRPEDSLPFALDGVAEHGSAAEGPARDVAVPNSLGTFPQ